MVELKTLKDFDWGDVIRCNACNFSADELKQEAIKWIKKLSNERTKLIIGSGLPNQPKPKEWIEVAQITSKIHWIKYFFNIMEEDLNGINV